MAPPRDHKRWIISLTKFKVEHQEKEGYLKEINLICIKIIKMAKFFPFSKLLVKTNMWIHKIQLKLRITFYPIKMYIWSQDKVKKINYKSKNNHYPHLLLIWMLLAMLQKITLRTLGKTLSKAKRLVIIHLKQFIWSVRVVRIWTWKVVTTNSQGCNRVDIVLQGLLNHLSLIMRVAQKLWKASSMSKISFMVPIKLM